MISYLHVRASAIVANHNRATMLFSCEPPDIFSTATTAQFWTSASLSPSNRCTCNKYTASSPHCEAGRVSYVVPSLSELSAALAEFRDCVKVSAVVADLSTSSDTAHIASHRRLPVAVSIDRRLGAKILLVDAKIPRESSMNGITMLLNCLARQPAVRSDC